VPYIDAELKTWVANLEMRARRPSSSRGFAVDTDNPLTGGTADFKGWFEAWYR
jgi:hypothetical protein